MTLGQGLQQATADGNDTLGPEKQLSAAVLKKVDAKTKMAEDKIGELQALSDEFMTLFE